MDIGPFSEGVLECEAAPAGGSCEAGRKKEIRLNNIKMQPNPNKSLRILAIRIRESDGISLLASLLLFIRKFLSQKCLVFNSH